MADAIVLPQDYYVYILYREDGVTPFYVGLGRKDRWLQHERKAKPGGTHKDNIIWGMKSRQMVVPKEKFAENLSKDEAVSLEISLIAAFGRAPLGPLVNRTRGGEGVVGIPRDSLLSMAKKARERFSSESVRKAHGEAIRKAWGDKNSIKRLRQSELTTRHFADDHARLANSERSKKVWSDPVFREKNLAARWTEELRKRHSDRVKGQPLSQQTKDKLSMARLAHVALPGTREKYSKAIKNGFIANGTAEKLRASANARWESSDERNLQSNRMKQVLANPDVKEKMRASSQKRWANDEERERYREIGRRAAEARWAKVRQRKEDEISDAIALGRLHVG